MMSSRKLAERWWFPCRPIVVLFAFIAVCISTMAGGNGPKPPTTRVDDVTQTLHGVAITDPYRWLEDQNSPETRAWINSENAYTRQILDTYPSREQLKAQIEKLMRIDTIGMPRVRAGRYFYTRRKADQNLDVLCMRVKNKETVLVDPNKLSADGSISVAMMGISEDGKVLAYGLRKGGADEVSLVLLNVDTGQKLADSFPTARYGRMEFTPDRKFAYYTKYIQKVGPRVYVHKLGTDPATDKELFGSAYGPGEMIGVDLSPDGHYLILSVSHGSAADKVEIYFQDLAKGGPITPVVNDISAAFSPHLAGNSLFLQTNWEAPNGRIIKVDLQNPARTNWKVVVPEGEFPMQEMSTIGGKLFVNYLENVVTHIKIFDADGKPAGEVKLPGIGTANISGEWNSEEAFYSFTSFSTPRAIYRYDTSTNKQDLWARIHVPVPTDQIETRQVWYESRDKTRIPMFLVYKKGTVLDGNRPTLLTGYGGFRLSRTASFSAEAALWVMRGGVFALPNLRGGGEFGEAWHEAGMLEKKQNVFDDFIAAAEWLIANKYTNPDKLAITGASNGGLLVGAALTQRPDLFRAVIVGYPLLDMLRYQKFLVARFWVPEYGSSDNAEQFKYLLAYSPYQNVKKGTKYPAVMFVSGDADTRVAPLHARKMAALLQASTGSSNPVLLDYDTHAGHSRGGVAISRQVDTLTDELSFLLTQLGENGTAPKSHKAD